MTYTCILEHDIYIDLCPLWVHFDTFSTCIKDSFFGYKRTAPTWIEPKNHVKKHRKDYPQSMTILTLLHVCSRDKYVKNPVKKTAKTFFVRVSNKQADLSKLVVLLHELKSSTKRIPQRNVVVLHQLVFSSICNIK